MHDSASVCIDERRHLAVEIRGEAVADVGQHQPLQPVLRLGLRVELIERGEERFHCHHDVHVQLAQSGSYRVEMFDLQRR
jgi:hypothetical protein